MGVQLEQWRWAEQLVEAALELEVRAASVEEAGAEQQVHWAEAEWEVASWTQLGVSLEEQHLKEVVRRKVGQLKGDPEGDQGLWPGKLAPVVVLQDGCLEWAVEPRDEPLG